MSKDSKRTALQSREDEVLRRMLATPPEVHKPRTKAVKKKPTKKKPA